MDETARDLHDPPWRWSYFPCLSPSCGALLRVQRDAPPPERCPYCGGELLAPRRPSLAERLRAARPDPRRVVSVDGDTCV